MAIAYYAEDIQLPAIKKKAVSGWIKAVAETYGKKTGDISYIFCSDEKILEVNRQYLQLQGVRFGIASIGLNTDFVEALPTMLMKPLSGSGARGMMLDAMNTYGADSFVGRLSSIVQGSCDTTFYVVALYYGSVGIRNTRYTVQCALLADLAGAIAAIAMAYLFF